MPHLTINDVRDRVMSKLTARDERIQKRLGGPGTGPLGMSITAQEQVKAAAERRIEEQRKQNTLPPEV